LRANGVERDDDHDGPDDDELEDDDDERPRACDPAFDNRPANAGVAGIALKSAEISSKRETDRHPRMANRGRRAMSHFTRRRTACNHRGAVHWLRCPINARRIQGIPAPPAPRPSRERP
jgi:hypothetical protein